MKYSSYYVNADFANKSGILKSWTFETEADFLAALNQGVQIQQGELVWIVEYNKLYRINTNKQLQELYGYSEENDKTNDSISKINQFLKDYNGAMTAQQLINEWVNLKQTPTAVLLNSLYTKGEGLGVIQEVSEGVTQQAITYPTGFGKYIVKLKWSEKDKTSLDTEVSLWIFPNVESADYSTLMGIQEPDFKFKKESGVQTIGSIIIPSYIENNKKMFIWDNGAKISEIMIIPSVTYTPTETDVATKGVTYDGGNASANVTLVYNGNIEEKEVEK